MAEVKNVANVEELALRVRAEHKAVGLAVRNVLHHAMAAGDARTEPTN